MVETTYVVLVTRGYENPQQKILWCGSSYENAKETAKQNTEGTGTSVYIAKIVEVEKE